MFRTDWVAFPPGQRCEGGVEEGGVLPLEQAHAPEDVGRGDGEARQQPLEEGGGALLVRGIHQEEGSIPSRLIPSGSA
jgi:hypothetical protein